MRKEKILVVDDEANILELLRYNLESSGYDVVETKNGEKALELIESEDIDAVILDLMLPGINGIEVLKRIRNSSRYKLPVIMLTAKNEEIDAILGLEMGADDYIGKPFRSRELISRLKAVIRRFNMDDSNSKTRDVYIEGPLEIFPENHQVFLNGKEIEMTLKEFGLLEKLISSPGRVFTREELLESVWGYDYVGETRTVDVHIRQLRKKLEEDDTVPKIIATVRGIGYKFKSNKGS